MVIYKHVWDNAISHCVITRYHYKNTEFSVRPFNIVISFVTNGNLCMCGILPFHIVLRCFLRYRLQQLPNKFDKTFNIVINFHFTNVNQYKCVIMQFHIVIEKFARKSTENSTRHLTLLICILPM